MDEKKDSILSQVAAKGLILPKGPTNGFTRAYLEQNTNSSIFAKYKDKLTNNWDLKCAKEIRSFEYINHNTQKRDINEWRKQGKMAFSQMIKSKSNKAFLEKQVVKEISIKNPIFKNDIKIYIHKPLSSSKAMGSGPALVYFHGGGAVLLNAKLYSHIMVSTIIY